MRGIKMSETAKTAKTAEIAEIITLALQIPGPSLSQHQKLGLVKKCPLVPKGHPCCWSVLMAFWLVLT